MKEIVTNVKSVKYKLAKRKYCISLSIQEKVPEDTVNANKKTNGIRGSKTGVKMSLETNKF
jgi:hypothetical protein